MFEYLKKVIEDGNTGTPSSKRWVLVISTISLCIGFLSATFALLFGVDVSDTIILGLGTVLAGLSGSSYISTKNKEVEMKREQTHDPDQSNSA